MPLHTGKVEAGGVLLPAAEDGVADTILLRIVAAGGDPSRVLVLGHDTLLWIPEDMHTVERGAECIGAKLIAVDPIMSFLGAGINSNTDKEVRTALSPLKHLAERIGAIVLIVRHLNKQQGSSAMYRGAGSIAFSGAARQGLMVDDHPREEGMKVLVGYKSNLSVPPPP
jgi:AAA domain-containing protein